MRILLTGGAGFIGSHIADAFIADGHIVHILDNLSSGSPENLHRDAIFHKMDVRNPDVVDLFERHQFDCATMPHKLMCGHRCVYRLMMWMSMCVAS